MKISEKILAAYPVVTLYLFLNLGMYSLWTKKINLAQKSIAVFFPNTANHCLLSFSKTKCSNIGLGKEYEIEG